MFVSVSGPKMQLAEVCILVWALLNFCNNFFLYIMASRTIRRELFLMLGFRKRYVQSPTCKVPKYQSSCKRVHPFLGVSRVLKGCWNIAQEPLPGGRGGGARRKRQRRLRGDVGPRAVCDVGVGNPQQDVNRTLTWADEHGWADSCVGRDTGTEGTRREEKVVFSGRRGADRGSHRVDPGGFGVG